MKTILMKFFNSNTKNLAETAPMTWLKFWGVSISSALLLVGCASDDPIADSSQGPDPVLTDFPLAYIKRPVPVDQEADDPKPRVAEIIIEPVQFNPGAVVLLRDRATPTAPETDITTRAFADPDNPDDIPLYDVRDLSVSDDGSKMIFAMRAPEIPNADEEDQPTWNIWEYELETDTLRRIITSDISAEDGNDLMPSYLPDGRIVFASTRQRRAKAILLDEGKPQFEGQVEALTNSAMVIHVMSDDGTNINQLTYNQSHDYYPTVTSDGRILFLRWDGMGNNNALSLYSVLPDGRDLQRVYGYHTRGAGTNGDDVILVRPQVTPEGELQVLAKPNQSLRHGGDVVTVNVESFIEIDQSIDGSTGLGQQSIAINPVFTDDRPSPGGIFNSVYPLWDNTNRALTSWSPCLLSQIDAETMEETIVPCSPEADPALLEAAPSYGIWIWDQNTDTQTPIIIAEPGFWLTEPVTFQEKVAATNIPDGVPGIDLDQELVDESVGVLHIRSVYDIDGVDVTTAGIPAQADPTITPVDAREARFLRIVKAVAIPDEEFFDFEEIAYGRSRNQLMREIIGYAPIEPDGSVKVRIPANIPFAISVLDRFGQRITGRHQNWLQLRPGEVYECQGCHVRDSQVPHGRRDAEPPSAYAGALTPTLPFPNTNPILFADEVGETMAEVATRINGVPEPSLDIVFDDIWTDPAMAAPAPSFQYRYQDLDTAAPVVTACTIDWFAACRITINYEEHIQPLFDKPRITFDVDGITVLQDDTCTACHNAVDTVNNVAQVPAGQLELTNNPSPDEALHMRGYRELFFPDNEVTVANGAVIDATTPVLSPDGDFIYQTLDADGAVVYFTDDDGMFISTPDPITGLPVELRDTDDSIIYQTDMDGVLQRDLNGDLIPIPIPIPAPNLLTTTIGIAPPMSVNGAINSGNRFFNLFRAGGSHEGRLTDAELKLLVEWVDIGGQYFNNPFLAPEE